MQGKINDLQVEVEQHESEIRNMLANETGLQTVTERVNDLVMQDGNIKLEEMQGNTVQNHVPIVYDTENQKSIGIALLDLDDGHKKQTRFLRKVSPHPARHREVPVSFSDHFLPQNNKVCLYPRK